jgi:putative ABC transport system permease protein
MSLRVIRKRLRYWVNRRRVELDLAEELETHRGFRQGQLEREGLDRRDAEAASRRALGNLTLAAEDVRDVWVVRWLDELCRDVRHGARLLRRSPGFTLVAVLSLSIGIGANTAIFSLIDAVILKSLPVEKPEDLVVLERVNTRGQRSNLSYQLFERLRQANQLFSGAFAALDGTYRIDVTRAGSSTPDGRAEVQVVSGDYFPVLGVRATLGRLLSPEDDNLAVSEPVAVISYGFWQQRFGADPSAIGQRLTLKHESVTIVGVTPPGFFGESVGRAPDMWVPITLQPRLDPPALLNNPNVGWLRVMARLRSDVTITRADAGLRAWLQGQKAESGPLAQALRQVSQIGIEPGRRGLSDTRTRFSQQLWILTAVVGVVLLIACANVANLLLVRGAARRHETMIRLAIGAGRWRLMRQFLTESALLAVLGGAVGLLLAWWGGGLLLLLASDGASPLAIDVAPNLRIVGFTLSISFLTVLLFGLAPAGTVTRHAFGESLKPVVGRPRLMLPRILLVMQVGLSLLLLTAAGLFLQTIRNLRTVDLGFAADEIVQVSINPQGAAYTPERLPDLYRRILARFDAAPGIRSAAMSTSGYRTGSSRTCCIAIEGHVPTKGEEREVQTMNVTSEYFRTMGIQLTSGRALSSDDVAAATPESPRVAVVNEALARQYFGITAVVGRRIGWGDPPSAKYDTEIVGVVRSALYGELRLGPRPIIYYPSDGGRYLSVRAALPVSSILVQVRREIQAVDPGLSLTARTVPEIRDQALVLELLMARLSSFFSIAALLLATVGLYGLMAYAVARRTKEIGICVALGAQRSRVVRQILSETLRLVGLGILFGTAAALATTRLFAGALFGVGPGDPMTLGLSMSLLTVVAALAGAVPARRAARVEPSVALRHE